MNDPFGKPIGKPISERIGEPNSESNSERPTGRVRWPFQWRPQRPAARRRWRLENRLLFATSILALCVLLLFAISARNVGALLDAQRWRVHTLEVLEQIAHVEQAFGQDAQVPLCALGLRSAAARTAVAPAGADTGAGAGAGAAPGAAVAPGTLALTRLSELTQLADPHAAPQLQRLAQLAQLQRELQADVAQPVAAACAGTLERIDHDQQLHQEFVGRRTGGLHDEDVARPHVLLDLDVDLAVGKARDLGFAELDAQGRRDLARQQRVGIAGKEDGVEEHGALAGGYGGGISERFGRGGRTRTLACRNQNPMP